VTAIRILSLVALAAVVTELCGRSVARGSFLNVWTGVHPSLGVLVFGACVAAAAGWFASRGRQVKPAYLFAALFAIGLAAQLHLGARLQSDGFYYFAYLRSIAFDRDVEFSNDYRLLGLGDKPHLFVPTPTGYAQSAWTIGPAIVWSPFFAAAHPVASRLQAGGADVNTIGTSYPYRQAVCIAGLFYALLGCWFIWRLTSVYFDRRLAAGAVALTVCGSFMLWYAVKEPSMTHAPAMAGVAGFAWLWARTHGTRTLAGWAILGAIAGFITLIRWQNALFAILPAWEAAALLLLAARRGDRAGLRSTIAAGLLFTACAALAFTPQMLAWKSIYGSYLAVSPVGPEIRWWDPQLVEILFSSRNGLFPWSPVLYLGAVGLALFAWVKPAAGLPMIVAIAAMVYFNASVQDWWGSAGFGGRRFDGTIPLLTVGVAAFVKVAADVVERHPLRTVGAAGGLLVAWNLALMSAAQDGHVRIGEAVSFGDTGALQARALHRWVGNPFTYPVSLWFAARNDVPISAYDLLAANRFLGDPLRPYGRIDVGQDDDGDGHLLTGGWHGAERSGEVTFRWATGRADMLVPLERTANLRVQVRAQAFNYPGAAPQTLTLSVNGAMTDAIAVPPEWTTVVVDVPADRWRAGVNRVELVFGRENRPADVGLGGDPRLLAAAVDYLRVQVIDQ
jgi:hypothetical protein